MTYKHGNWYCKPANEAEAREIVERAVASGAERDETAGDLRWDDCDAWGVIDGRTYTGGIAHAGQSFYGQTQYTITQLRKLFPLPGERVEHEQWSPSPGERCEVFRDGKWRETNVVGLSSYGSIVYECDEFSDIPYDGNSPSAFRPLHTEREKWVSEAQKHCTEFGSNQLGKLYDALKSGELKAPEVLV